MKMAFWLRKKGTSPTANRAKGSKNSSSQRPCASRRWLFVLKIPLLLIIDASEKTADFADSRRFLLWKLYVFARPFFGGLKDISLEMVFRGLYHFAQARQKGQANDLIEYFTRKAKALSLIKQKRKAKHLSLIEQMNLTISKIA